MDRAHILVDERGGTPPPPYALSLRDPRLQKAGKLAYRRLGNPKAGLRNIDLIPFYTYVHVDMRSDWSSRKLKRGSPAGGDLATWWTARSRFRWLFTPNLPATDPLRSDCPPNPPRFLLQNHHRPTLRHSA